MMAHLWSRRHKFTPCFILCGAAVCRITHVAKDMYVENAVRIKAWLVSISAWQKRLTHAVHDGGCVIKVSVPIIGGAMAT